MNEKPITRSELARLLRFYFITDQSAPGLSALEQVRAALKGGATFVQYRNKSAAAEHLPEARAIRDLCRLNGIPFVVNDNVRLAEAVKADGVHLGQDDTAPAEARCILGNRAVIGISISTPEELARTDLAVCDYAGSGPVFATGTKADAKPVRGLGGLGEMVRRIPLPVVAIGGINAERAGDCLSCGAAGVAVISAVSRAADPLQAARRIAEACGRPPRESLTERLDAAQALPGAGSFHQEQRQLLVIRC